jgi:hypothetical protein
VMNPHHPPVGDPEYDARANKIRNYLRINPREIVLGLAGGSIARRQGGQVSLVHGPGFLYTAGGARALPEGPVDELSALAAAGI